MKNTANYYNIKENDQVSFMDNPSQKGIIKYNDHDDCYYVEYKSLYTSNKIHDYTLKNWIIENNHPNKTTVTLNCPKCNQAITRIVELYTISDDKNNLTYECDLRFVSSKKLFKSHTCTYEDFKPTEIGSVILVKTDNEPTKKYTLFSASQKACWIDKDGDTFNYEELVKKGRITKLP